jgi:hypothetical protein
VDFQPDDGFPLHENKEPYLLFSDVVEALRLARFPMTKSFKQLETI